LTTDLLDLWLQATDAALPHPPENARKKKSSAVVASWVARLRESHRGQEANYANNHVKSRAGKGVGEVSFGGIKRYSRSGSGLSLWRFCPPAVRQKRERKKQALHRMHSRSKLSGCAAPAADLR